MKNYVDMEYSWDISVGKIIYVYILRTGNDKIMLNHII